MAVLTVRNLPDEVHRASRVRAALRGRSTEAEVRAILAETVMPEGGIGLGSLLTAAGQRAGLTEEEFAGFAHRTSPQPRGRAVVILDAERKSGKRGANDGRKLP